MDRPLLLYLLSLHARAHTHIRAHAYTNTHGTTKHSGNKGISHVYMSLIQIDFVSVSFSTCKWITFMTHYDEVGFLIFFWFVYILRNYYFEKN